MPRAPMALKPSMTSTGIFASRSIWSGATRSTRNARSVARKRQPFPFASGLSGLPGRHGSRVAQGLETVALGLVEGLAQPRQVIGDAARALLGGVGLRLPRILVPAPLRHTGRASEGDAESAEPVGLMS